MRFVLHIFHFKSAPASLSLIFLKIFNSNNCRANYSLMCVHLNRKKGLKKTISRRNSLLIVLTLSLPSFFSFPSLFIMVYFKIFILCFDWFDFDTTFIDFITGPFKLDFNVSYLFILLFYLLFIIFSFPFTSFLCIFYLFSNYFIYLFFIFILFYVLLSFLNTFIDIFT